MLLLLAVLVVLREKKTKKVLISTEVEGDAERELEKFR